MGDGSLIPDGILMSDSFIKTNFFSNVGSRKYIYETSFTNAISILNKSFYPEGLKKSNGRVYGRTVFSVNGYQIRGNCLMNPASMASGVGTESTQLFAGQDDMPKPGITKISGDGQYSIRNRSQRQMTGKQK